jgi:hypothetical protein
MRELHTTAVVDEKGGVELRLQTDLPPGRHSFTLLIDEGEFAAPGAVWNDFPTLSVGGILPGFSLHREDFYDELEPKF